MTTGNPTSSGEFSGWKIHPEETRTATGQTKADLDHDTTEGVLKTAKILAEQLSKNPNDEKYIEWIRVNEELVRRINIADTEQLGIKPNKEEGLPSTNDTTQYFSEYQTLFRDDARSAHLIKKITELKTKLKQINIQELGSLSNKKLLDILKSESTDKELQKKAFEIAFKRAKDNKDRRLSRLLTPFKILRENQKTKEPTPVSESVSENETILTDADMEEITTATAQRPPTPPPPPQIIRPTQPLNHKVVFPVQPPVRASHEIPKLEKIKTAGEIVDELTYLKIMLKNAQKTFDNFKKDQLLMKQVDKETLNEKIGTFLSDKLLATSDKKIEGHKSARIEELTKRINHLNIDLSDKRRSNREQRNLIIGICALFSILLATVKDLDNRIDEGNSELTKVTRSLENGAEQALEIAHKTGIGEQELNAAIVQAQNDAKMEPGEKITEVEMEREEPASTLEKTNLPETKQPINEQYTKENTITLGANSGFYKAADQVARKVGREELVKRLTEAKPDWFVKFANRTEHWRTPAQKKKGEYSDAQKESMERLWKIYELVNQENYSIQPGAKVGYKYDKSGVPHLSIIDQGHPTVEKNKSQKTQTGELEEMLQDVKSAPSETKTAVQDNVLQHAIDMEYVKVDEKTGQLSLQGNAKRSPIFKEIAGLVADYDRDVKEGIRTPVFGQKFEKTIETTKPQKQTIDTNKTEKTPTLGQQENELSSLLAQLNPRNIGERNTLKTKGPIELENVPGIGWVPKTDSDFRQLNQLYQDGDEIAVKIFDTVNKFNSAMSKKSNQTDITPWYMQTASQAKKDIRKIAGTTKEPDWKELAAIHKAQVDVDSETFITRKFPDPKIKEFMSLRGDLLEKGQVTVKSLWGLTSKKIDIGKYLPNLPTSPDLDKSKLSKIFLETKKGVEKLRHDLARGDTQTESALAALDQLLGELGNKYK